MVVRRHYLPLACATVDVMAMRRTVTVSLSSEQQQQILPILTAVSRKELGVSEHQAGAVVVETLGRLTADSALSLLAINKVLTEELRAYAAAPEAYERRTQETIYKVSSLDDPSLVPHPSPDLISYASPNYVPTKALPQSEWWDFSHELDGYEVAERIGWDLTEFAPVIIERHQRTGVWSGSMLDLRLVLFYKASALRFQGIDLEDVGEEAIASMESLLEAIARLASTAKSHRT